MNDPFARFLLICLSSIIIFGCENEQIGSFKLPVIAHANQKSIKSIPTFDDNFPSNDSPKITDDYVIVSKDQAHVLDQNGKMRNVNPGLFVLDKANFKLNWSHEQGNNLYDISENSIFLSNDYIASFSLQNGKLQWLNHPPSRFDPFWQPYVIDRFVIVSVGSEKLTFCFDSASGKLIWKRAFFVTTNPQFDFQLKRLYVADPKIGLLSIKLETGEIVWKSKSAIKTVFHPVLSGSLVIVSGGKFGHLYAYNRETGDLVWEQQDVFRERYLPYPVKHEQKLIVVGLNSVFSIQSHSGKIQWQFGYNREKNRIIQLSQISNNVYITFKNKKYLAGLDIESGNVVERVDINNQITSPYVHEDSSIYYLSNDVLFTEKVPFSTR